MTATDNCVRHCPKCGSVRVHHSRRKGFLEGLLVMLGGEICRGILVDKQPTARCETSPQRAERAYQRQRLK